MKKIKFNALFLLFAYALYSCHDNKKIGVKSNQQLLIEQDPLSLLTKADTVIMNKAILSVVRKEKSSSNHECLDIRTFYDKENKIVIIRSINLCNSDMRTTMAKEEYFDQELKIILEVSLNGLQHVLYVKHKKI